MNNYKIFPEKLSWQRLKGFSRGFWEPVAKKPGETEPTRLQFTIKVRCESFPLFISVWARILFTICLKGIGSDRRESLFPFASKTGANIRKMLGLLYFQSWQIVNLKNSSIKCGLFIFKDPVTPRLRPRKMYCTVSFTAQSFTFS